MRKQHLVIAGGGTAGWMAANLLAKQCDSTKLQISLVESPNIGIIGVGEGSTPTLKRFFEIIETPESEWMPQCNATYKMGIEFHDWSPLSGRKSYRHPFISKLDIFNQKAFEVNCRTRRMGLNTHTAPEDFLINGVLGRQNKGPNVPYQFPFELQYGYHFDSVLLGKFLSKKACEMGVRHIQDDILGASVNDEGEIDAIVCKRSNEIKADFFIDCTGFNSLLLQGALNVEFETYKSNLFNDSAVVIPTLQNTTIRSETDATAMKAGWSWKIPLTNRTGNGYVYSSDFINSDAAEKELRLYLGVEDSVESRHLKMKVGQVKQHWYRNCLAIGLAQGFIEPLEATALHLVQICMEMFVTQYKNGEYSSADRERYNGFAKTRFDRVRDYIVAHYKLNTRDDSEYWIANRNNDHISHSLAEIIRTWFNRGDLSQEIRRQDIGMHWDPISWHCLFSGYGAYPKLAPNQPGKGDHYIDMKVEDFLLRCASNFSSHEENLAKLLKA